MAAALSARWRGARHLNHRGYQYIWANVFWAVLSLPVITAPAAFAGLCRFSYVAARQPAPGLDEFWAGFRENLKRGIIAGLLTIVIVTVNGTNLLAYRHSDAQGMAALRFVWGFALVLWFGLQFYAWPLMQHMERPSLKGAYRNALVMMALNPMFTLVCWFLIAIVIVLSLVFPVAWLLLTGSVLAVAATSAVADRVAAAGFSTGFSMLPEALEKGG